MDWLLLLFRGRRTGILYSLDGGQVVQRLACLALHGYYGSIQKLSKDSLGQEAYIPTS